MFINSGRRISSQRCHGLTEEEIYINEGTVPLTRNRNSNHIYIYIPYPTRRPKDQANHRAARASTPIMPLGIPSIKGNGHAVVGRSDLRRRVRIRSPNERLLQCRRLPPQFFHYVIGSCSIGGAPVVARSGVQHVRCARRALPTVTRSAFRGRVEQCAGGYVWVVVDVLTEALACPVRRGRERCAPVASLLQAHVAPGCAGHVQFHPCGRQEVAALHGA